MRAALTALLLTFASQAGAEFGNMCEHDWWWKTTADVQSELDAGTNVNAVDDDDGRHCITPLGWAHQKASKYC